MNTTSKHEAVKAALSRTSQQHRLRSDRAGRGVRLGGCLHTWGSINQHGWLTTDMYGLVHPSVFLYATDRGMSPADYDDNRDLIWDRVMWGME
jgi:hypothetical protein